MCIHIFYVGNKAAIFVALGYMQVQEWLELPSNDHSGSAAGQLIGHRLVLYKQICVRH